MDVMCPHCSFVYQNQDKEIIGVTVGCENCGKAFTAVPVDKANLAGGGSKPMRVARPVSPSPSLPVASPVGNASGDTQACPFCAETIKAKAVVCRFCGRDLPNAVGVAGARGGAPTTRVASDFGILLLLVPLGATFLTGVWITSLNLLQDPGGKLLLVQAGMVVVTAMLAAFEVSTRPPDPATKDDSPVATALGMMLLWVIVFPVHMSRRARYGLTNYAIAAGVVAIINLAVFVAVFTAIENRKEELRGVLKQFSAVRIEQRIAADWEPRRLGGEPLA